MQRVPFSPEGRALSEAKLESVTDRSRNLLARVEQALFDPVDIAPLVAWRVLFGLLMMVEAIGSILTGWVKEVYVAPKFHFPYIGFEWVQPIPGYSMYVHYVLLAVFGALAALGLFHRAASALLAIGWIYAFLLEKTSYQNHYYLMALLALLMAWVPAHRAASLDAWRRPELQSSVACAWTLDVFRVLVALVYFYAGIAKLNADWLSLLPIEQWLKEKADYPVVGRLFALHGVAIAFAYGGLLLDLTVGPLLLWRRTRLLALGVTIVFHLLNLVTFRIGIFPFLAISLGVLFLPPSWVNRPLRRFLQTEAARGQLPGAHPWVMPALTAFFLVQVLLPLRHHLIEGDVAWSGQGHRFSWRMMLVSKRGEAVFHVFDPASGERFDVQPEEFLHGRQVAKLATRPDIIWQFARMLETHYRAEGRAELEIRATVRVSLNFRPPELLVDPSVDLTSADYSPFRRPAWILPGPTEADVGK